MLPRAARPRGTRGLTRREFLRFGSLGALGFCGLGADAVSRTATASASGFGQARSLLVISLYGGPGHLDLWDLKPEAPAEVRGEFRPIPTTVSGVRICEHLPRLAKLAHRYAIVRSVSHEDNGHRSAAYASLTGWPHAAPNTDPLPSVADHPGYGSVASLLHPHPGVTPSQVAIGSAFVIDQLPGERAGFLGAACDPFVVLEDPNRDGFGVPELTLAGNMPFTRLDRRRLLLQQTDGAARLPERAAGPGDLAALQQRSLALLAAPKLRQAFRLESESAPTRERYGRTTVGQSLLLARRLLEAEVPYVLVNWDRDGGLWDTHSDNFKTLRERLLPAFDNSVSALLEDLEQRGLLETTLVLLAGEFGRTPKVNQAAGRDHWPFVYSVVMAGGGVQGGRVHGASDEQAAYPASDPVGPWDVAATLYHCLGIPPEIEVRDLQNRPFRICRGEPIHSLL